MKKNIIKIALKDTKRYFVLLVLLSISISYLTLMISLCVKNAVDNVMLKYIDVALVIHDLLMISIFIVLLNFIKNLINYFRNRITTKFKLKINVNIKSELYKHMLKLEYKSYNIYDKAEIMQRINEDADVYSKFFNNQFNVILDIIFLSIFIIRESAILNVEISIYIFFTIIIMILFSTWYFIRLNKYIDNMIIKRKQLLKVTMRNISNFKFVRMFNKQKEEKDNYKALNKSYSDEEIKFIKLVLFYDIILEHLAYLRSPIIYMLGGIAIIKRKNDNWCFISIAFFI
ncbi:MAG: ABC transporter transmembrane domain-containing protein [Clostridia bacterium]|nr:ABC transporter transmembrane domain-containing protein [Clostridia bacterium]